MPKRRHSDLDVEYDTGSEQSTSQLSSSRSARRPRLNLAQDDNSFQSSQDSSAPPSGATIHPLSRESCVDWDLLTPAEQEIVSEDWKMFLLKQSRLPKPITEYDDFAILMELGLCGLPSSAFLVLAAHPDISPMTACMRNSNPEHPRPYYQLMSHGMFIVLF